MFILRAVVHFIKSRVLLLITLLEHRRSYGRELRRGAPNKRKVRSARGEWWGDHSNWYPSSTPPRQHNRVTPLIDGESYFTALPGGTRRSKRVRLRSRLVPHPTQSLKSPQERRPCRHTGDSPPL